MKKLFTLLVGTLMAGSAFGQANWTNIVVNGDFEAEAPAYENYAGMAADAWNSFWVHEWPKGEAGETQYQGTVTIVDGVGNNGTRCAKVVARSDEQAIAAGNRTEANGALASWDCQFFIYATEPMPQGKEVRLTMWVKGDKAGSIETQAHWGPGDYNHYQLFGNVSVTTEWQKVVLEGTVTADQSKEADGKAFQSVAFNLSTDKEGNVFYFDDVKLQMRDPKQDDGSDAGAWINFMRRGIYSKDNIVGKNDQGATFQCTNYTFQDLTKPEGEQQQPAPVVEVPGEPGVMAVHIPVQGYKIVEEPDLDEEGQPQYDEDGNEKMKSVYYWNDGRLVPGINGNPDGAAAPARWMCQFFVSTLHKMVPGEKYRFKFRAKADKPTSLGTQAHFGPGQYKDYNTFGSETDFPIGTDWTEFNLGEAQGKTIPSGVGKPTSEYGCQTITFDCVPLEGEDNNFYLIVDEFSFTEKYVLDSDRTLGDPEELQLPINEGEEEKATQIDMANMLTTFELEDFDFLKNPKSGDGMKLFMIKEPDDPEDDPIESFSGLLPWADGGFINGQGQYIDEDTGVQLYFDDESIDGTKVNLNVWNNPDSGIPFAEGKTVQTKLAISNAGWYYVYNITLGTEATLAGIKTVKTEKVNNGYIYNLSGQRVDESYKGLVIKNGQKLIQK
jgi:hypothetical protein